MFPDFPTILNNYLKPGGIVAGAYLAGYLLAFLVFYLVRRYGALRSSNLLQSIRRNLKRPARFLIPLLVALAALPVAGFEADLQAGIHRLVQILVYIGVAWLIIEFTDVVGDLIRDQYRLDVADNLEERKIITQMQYVKKVVGVVVTTITVAFILMQFQTVKELGAGLLTSAGIAGIVIGIAAQRPISNMLAGFQIAFTQPIRIDDVVIAEGEWGRVEEITLTYVVIRIWDQRRLVLPLTYFIEKPFQNWTRTSADILGTVYIYADYRMPVQPLRQKLTELLENSELWDKRVNVLQVTNATDATMEIRALMSTRNSSEAWDLRCHVREQLIRFIQQEYPECLPRTRVELPEQSPPPTHPSEPQDAFHEKKGLSDSKETSVDKPGE
jgi:small-conductance mechanosensitive channel